MKESRFDLDLRFGQEGERWLTLLASEQKMEVKRERDTWATTGNICFEFRCGGLPSGLAATEADWWAHILSLNGETRSVLVFNVPQLKQRLRELVRTQSVPIVRGGDGERSEMILFPLRRLHELL